VSAVGVIANPASGRDIRRLVTGASVFDNAEKGSMVHRLMAGLGAAGVTEVLMMPAADGISTRLLRGLRAHTGEQERQRLPELHVLPVRTQGTWRDTVEATEAMLARDVQAIVVLGGDGTHRIVARHCGDVPLCALSTGTNNCFPEMREATVAGLATGLVARAAVNGSHSVRRAKVLHIDRDGELAADCALVDVAVSGARFTGARALWRAGDVTEVFVAFATASAVGWSAVAGLLDTVPRHAPHGLHVRLADPDDAPRVLKIPLAPGLVARVGVTAARRLLPEEAVAVAARDGSIALDGERELELRPGQRVEVRLNERGPLTIDIDAVMAEAARGGLLEDDSLAAVQAGAEVETSSELA
jgi:predicted polyphosphate/ATP-dependent NAD kinase